MPYRRPPDSKRKLKSKRKGERKEEETKLNDKVNKTQIKELKINSMFTIKQVLVDNPNFIPSTRTVIFNKITSLLM